MIGVGYKKYKFVFVTQVCKIEIDSIDFAVHVLPYFPINWALAYVVHLQIQNMTSAA